MQKNTISNDDATITCYVSGIPQTHKISYESGAYLKELFSALVKANAKDPSSTETQKLQQQILLFAEQQSLLPTCISADKILIQLQKHSQTFETRNIGGHPGFYEGTSKEFFCNFVSTGEGSAFPIIILPRFIPIIMAPIPRVFVGWKTPSGITSVGGLISRTGFIASGQQEGLALGFWGIGFSIFLPPVMGYGMFGYALYAKVSAENMEYWPPNNPPEITQTDPVDGEEMVPVTTSTLRFTIEDYDGDLMSYSVTTTPNIGSGSGGLKPDGIYSIALSGLDSLTTYTCIIQVTDGKDSVDKTITFTTEPAAPFISNPLPDDDERDVPMNLPQLQFTLKDYQGDALEYTVQTSPDVGSDHKTGVYDGTYTVPISGMEYGAEYRWYVNVTDGTHWARKTYRFSTGYPSPFDPFEYGWQYRKQITINHTQVAVNLENFPVLLSTTDSDLIKAQADGDDILFMTNTGASVKLRHELEIFNHVTGALTTWVNIPLLSAVEDTVFYMYYGNPDCINQEYPEKTWNSHYIAVWHMDDLTDSTIDDSCDNNYIGLKTASNQPQQDTGKIGKSQDFDGTDDFIQFTHTIIPTGMKTISGWFVSHTPNDWDIVLTSATGISSSDSGTGWALKDSGNRINCYMGNGVYADEPSHFMRVFPTIPDTTSWHYYTMTYDGITLSAFRDGMMVDSTTTKSGSETTPTHNLRMGRSNTESLPYPLDGGLDEIRIADESLSYEWITTEYTNQNSPAEFIFLGVEESNP